MAVKRTFGVGPESGSGSVSQKKVIQYINLKLSSLGFKPEINKPSDRILELAQPLLNSFREQSRLLKGEKSPIGKRLQDFIDDYLKDVPGNTKIQFPEHPFNLDRYGIARVLSIPPDSDVYKNDYIHSYRTQQGVLHNPKSDRRTTKGVFHISEGGLPIPDDKKAVPKSVFCRLLQEALNPPVSLMELPFTANKEEKAAFFVSLLLRPIVLPEVPGVTSEKSLEVRFYVPGNLVSNLDFVESIFGNAGDPILPENDSALNPDNWTGHTGCVILAPHLIGFTKKELGLPHYDNATDRQRRDGMCWKDENEKYNDGSAFKITARDERGVVITLIADNYFGYCKKEVKTMIGYSSNLYGVSEEEHAGGALAFRSYNLGEKFYLDERLPNNKMTITELVSIYSNIIEVKPEGYGVDKSNPKVVFVPQDAIFDLLSQTITWKVKGEEKSIKLLPGKFYIYPSGYRVDMRKRIDGVRWHLVGTVPDGTLCHKPCTVSGGGKSEISKSIQDAMIQGPVIVGDIQKDLDMVEEIMKYDFSQRFKVPADYSKNPPRSILSSRRSLGSVIKLFTPSDEYTEEYNAWLKSMPQRVRMLLFVIKGNYSVNWDVNNWRKYFTVDKVNGLPGNELKYKNRKLLSNYLRVGMDADKSWRVFLLRQDYNASQKVQFEDDISASVVVSAKNLEYLNPEYKNSSVKLLTNCESRLFQRPDDSVIKGYDKQAEKDLSTPNAFISNFEPLTRDEVQNIKDDTIGFEQYTQPVKDLINQFLTSDSPDYLVLPSEPRIVDGVPTKNQRYLQTRPDLVDSNEKYVAELTTRISRKIPVDKPLFIPVNAVLTGRRNNPAEPENNVPPLAIYNPIHYQELPELFIDFICSITGKSPSTTGFGSEGALTKGPFNSLLPSSDLNNAFLSFVLTGYHGFSSAAGYIGPNYKVEHDISLLVPEVWCRMSVEERDPAYLIKNGYLEKVENFEHKGKVVDASQLGYRITLKFVVHFMARIFSKPDAVFTDDMLRPELQDVDVFAETINNLSLTQERVAKGYMSDGTYERLCPPLQALVSVMATGSYKGLDRNHPDFRKMFERETILQSNWYNERLVEKQKRDIALWSRNVDYLQSVLELEHYNDVAENLELPVRLSAAKAQLKEVKADSYIKKLEGTIGADTLRPITV
jgi:phosphoenolpyruvate carboxykinase (diphosphate)